MNLVSLGVLKTMQPKLWTLRRGSEWKPVEISLWLSITFFIKVKCIFIPIWIYVDYCPICSMSFNKYYLCGLIRLMHGLCSWHSLMYRISGLWTIRKKCLVDIKHLMYLPEAYKQRKLGSIRRILFWTQIYNITTLRERKKIVSSSYKRQLFNFLFY